MKINFTSFRFRVGLMIVSVIGFIFFTTSQVQAIPVAVVADAPRSISAVLQAVKDAFVKVGKVTFLNSLRSLVNQFAYDTATYLGSGGQGQKPVYFTQEFGPWLRDQAFNVGGQFIEEFAQTPEGEFIDKYNICSPDLSVTVKISLGLTDFANKSGGLAESRCNLKKIYEEGRNSVDLYLKPGYLKNLAITAFEPESTDIGVATTIFDQFSEKVAIEKESLGLGRLESDGWIPETTMVSKALKSVPDNQKSKLEQARTLQTQNFFTQTGDIFVDAANIFLNQLALSAFNKLIDNLSRSNNYASGGSSGYYSQSSNGGITEATHQNSTILQARFNERADYDILSQLTACKDETVPGPTECVIDKQFAQAVEQQLTIAEAVQRGLLDGKARVGYNPNGNLLSYTEGYPYRSLIILRKYRILPVGWEIAAQYIQAHAEETKDLTLLDLMACFSTSDISYPGLDADWCRGLIDPYWVLKLPKLYCGMEGYGPQILGSTVYNASQDGITDDFRVALTRNSGYCGDERSCIRQNSNGTCAQYGYCTEEKRTWAFNQSQDSTCDALNNTCQTFKNDTGKQASFLENTLDYGNCDANQVGCKQYALEGPYDEVTKKIAWDDTGKQAFFNKNASECDPTKENCHQFIRTKDGLDSNLIADGSFEQSTCIDVGGTCELTDFTAQVNNLPSPNNRWYILVGSGTVKAGIVNTKADTGSQSLYIEGNGSWFSQEVSDYVPLSSRYSVLPDTFVMEGGHYYTFSARVFVEQGTVVAGFGYSSVNHIESTVTNQWQTLRVTIYKPPVGGPWTNYFVGGRNASTKFYVDNVKLTVGPAASDYSEYGENATIYQKLLPKYLAATCYASGGREPYTLKDDAPDECKQFARQCNDSEVGCESYTSLDSGLNITGKVTVPDYCPSSCVGYNTFVQQPNAFNPRQAFYFIPTTARSCGAQAVGCTAFTNLDKLDQGGEAVEYYSAMRKCIKPDPTKCLPFYTWEGSDESGFQLKVFSLQKDPGSRLGDEPLSTMPSAEETLLCNTSIFTKLPTDPGYNYDCRQFYAQDGTISYHLLEKTITCSDDCHPYRRELTTAASCIAAGGDWDATQNRCLYYAIPGEGKQCAASDVGCSEFTGNIASNTRNVFNPSISTFEQITTPPFDGWFSSDPLFRSNFSLNLGGHSLLGNSMSKVVGVDVQQNKSYNLTFLARSAVGVPTFIQKTELVNETGDTADFGVTGTSIPAEWKLYSFNLSNLNHTVSPAPDGDNWTHTGEKLNLVFNDIVFIDNVKLTEIPNRYYLIRYSWNTPAECDQDFSGAASAGYMLGCSQYKKADNSRVNLRSFTDLCSDSSAGCESMIDTYNSDDYRKSVINDDNYNGTTDPTDNNGTCDPGELSCIETPKDNLINVIYDPSKQCGIENKGCQRVGRATTYDGLKTFSDVYIKNNPDRYNTTVCTAQGVGCSKWTSPDGDAYFKDPGKEVCEWRLGSVSTSQYQWYKKDLKRCDGVGLICTSNADCSSAQTCQDILCSVSPDKTIGLGGKGNVIYQPSAWAGLCQSSQAGCTEYIDPLSKFNENLIINPSYKQPDITSSIIEGWTPIPGSPITEATQTISLIPQTLYILKGSLSTTSPRSEIKLSCPLMKILDSNNNFSNSTLIDYNIDPNSSAQFYIPITIFSDPYRPVSCTLTLRRTPSLNPNNGDTVYLRKAIVGYQYKTMLDKTSHNNLVNFGKGAVLFNERSQNGQNKTSLIFNADATYDNPIDGESPQTTGNHNTNILVQVRPDRMCSKWLDCLSYIPDPNNPNNKICLDIGECEAFAADGTCASRVTSTRTNRSNDNTLFSNLTGYSKIGYRDSTFRSLTDYYNLTAMSQVGETVDVKNPSFENDDGAGGGSSWVFTNSSIFSNPSLISDLKLNPLQKISSQQRDVRYLVPDGVNLAKISTGGTIKSLDLLDFKVGRRYVLSMYTYGQGGRIKIGLIPSGSSTPFWIMDIDGADQPQQWVKRTIGFKPTATSYYLVFESGGNDCFIDDIKIESGLNVRCTDPDADPLDCINPTLNLSDPQPQYVGSSCRLYPSEDALSCLHTDANNITSQGVKGYCIENDPRNPSVCLLWYPVDRIASDPMEEGGGITFNGDVYYCLDAKDECKPAPDTDTPQLYCSSFIKVDTSQYWAGHLAENSSLKLPDTTFPESPYFYPSSTRRIDFGGSIGQINIPPLPRKLVEDYFGSDIETGPLGSTKKIVQVSSTPPYRVTSSLPYSGSISLNQCTIAPQPFYFTPSHSGSYWDCGSGWCTNVTHDYWKGSEDDGSATTSIIGQWDMCVPRYAIALDYNGGCGTNCYPSDIQGGSNVFGFKLCNSFTDGLGSYTCDTVGTGAPNNKACRTQSTGYRTWNLIADDGTNSDDVGCVAYCYNRAKEVSVTQRSSTLGPSYALDVIKRLFPRTSAWQIYNWNGSSYVPGTSISHPLPNPITTLCPPSGRPAIDNTNADYCYIYPKISNYKIDGKSGAQTPIIINGRGYATFSFDTKTDIEQRPLKQITIDLGYDTIGGRAVYNPSGGNFADLNPRYYTTLYDYDQIQSGGNIAIKQYGPTLCNGATECFYVTPALRIMDNWDKFDDLNSGEEIKIIVKKPS